MVYVLYIEIIERLKSHVRGSLLLLEELELPGFRIPLPGEAAFELLPALALPVGIVEFTIPGLLCFVII